MHGLGQSKRGASRDLESRVPHSIPQMRIPILRLCLVQSFRSIVFAQVELSFEKELATGSNSPYSREQILGPEKFYEFCNFLKLHNPKLNPTKGSF
jgi:hypothetical protein